LSGLAAHLELPEFRTTIISAEMFSRQSESNVETLKATLSVARRPFKVIMIIRDLLEQIVSMYGQKVRHGNNTYDFDTFFATRINEPASDPFATAKIWANVFGWEALRVRLLDQGHLLNGDLIDDFLSCAGVDVARPEIRLLPRQERVNESSGWKCLEAGRALFSGRHGLRADHPLAMSLSAARVDAGGKRVLRDMRLIEIHSADIARENGWAADRGRYLTREQAQKCLDVYGSAVRELNRFLDCKLPEPLDLDQRGFVEREFQPDSAHIPVGELTSHYDELGSRLAAEGLVGRLTKAEFRDYSRRHRPVTGPVCASDARRRD
jgi:hypothetical protein